VKDRTDAMWHVATYVLVNAFLWSIVPRAAFWVTIGWGIGLVFHVAYDFMGDDGPENPRYQKYLARERAREEQESGFQPRPRRATCEEIVAPCDPLRTRLETAMTREPVTVRLGP
jgi:hypothetical protein